MERSRPPRRLPAASPARASTPPDPATRRRQQDPQPAAETTRSTSAARRLPRPGAHWLGNPLRQGGSPGTNFGIGGGGTGGTLGVTADAAPLSAAAIVPGATDGDAGGGAGGDGSGGGQDDGGDDSAVNDVPEQFGQVFGSVPELLEFVPESFKIALAGLAALSILLGLGYLLSAIRNRRLERQRGELLKEVGLLQTRAAAAGAGSDRRAAHLGGLPPGRRPRRGWRLLRRAAAGRRARRLHPRRRVRPRARRAGPHRVHALHAARLPRGRTRAAGRAAGRRARDRREPWWGLRNRAPGRARSGDGLADVRDRRAPGADRRRPAAPRARHDGLLAPDWRGREDRAAPDDGATGARRCRLLSSPTG